MTNYSKLIPCPHFDAINIGLSPAHLSTMLHIFGEPGALTTQCSEPTNPKLIALLEERNVGPFKVRGLAKLLAHLKEIFDEVKEKLPEVFAQVRNDGMICVRAVHGTQRFSNHSFGGAIDIRFGDESDEVGDGKMQLGAGALAPFFQVRGWYWGIGFGESNPAREDSMHFEASDELIRELYGKEAGLFNHGQPHMQTLPSAAGIIPVKLSGGALTSNLFASDLTLEAIAEGHGVLAASSEMRPEVGPVQDALNRLGFDIDLGSQNRFRGFFGPKTQAALRDFQNRHHLQPSGEVQQETMLALDEALRAGTNGPAKGTSLGLVHSGGKLPKRLPKYAEPILSEEAGVPWAKAKALPDFDRYDGVLPGSVCLFEGLKDLPSNVTTALIYECKLTIDSDGIADAGDVDHQGQTSLRLNDARQTSLNAKKDSFAVIPLDRAEAAAEGKHKDSELPDFGDLQIKLGDIGVAFWEKTPEFSVFVIGDKGPANALGEGSIKMADNLKIPSNPSNGGFNSKDVKDMRRGVMHIIFPGSTDALKKKGLLCTSRTREEIAALGEKLFNAFRSRNS